MPTTAQPSQRPASSLGCSLGGFCDATAMKPSHGPPQPGILAASSQHVQNRKAPCVLRMPVTRVAMARVASCTKLGVRVGKAGTTFSGGALCARETMLREAADASPGDQPAMAHKEGRPTTGRQRAAVSRERLSRAWTKPDSSEDSSERSQSPTSLLDHGMHQGQPRDAGQSRTSQRCCVDHGAII
jgi:hypothetical protein